MLILASASTARAALLREAGVPFVAAPSGARELKGRGRTLRQAALDNAKLKAATAAQRFPGRWILAADTMIGFRGRLYGKPRDRKAALRLLETLAGRTHSLATGLVLRKDRRVIAKVVISRVTFRPLDLKALEHLTRNSDPTRFAGGYSIRPGRDPLVENVRGSFSNVVGLPMETLLPLLQRIR